jgi:hypothetical protein
MISKIQVKFNNLIETIPVEEGSNLSLTNLLSFASSSFGVNFEKVKVYQELPDTGNLLIIANNEDFKEILNSGMKECVLRIILDEPIRTTTKSSSERKKPEKENKNKKIRECKDRKKKHEKWYEHKSQLAFECGSKRLNEQYGTSVTPQDLKIIFDTLEIHPFHLARCDLLPRGFFQCNDENEEKKKMDEWQHVKSSEINSGNDSKEEIMCNAFTERLKLGEEESSDSEDSSGDDNKEGAVKGKDNEGEKDVKKERKCKNFRWKMMKRRWQHFLESGMPFPPMSPMMYGPPPYLRMHHGYNNELMCPPFDFHYPHHSPFDFHHPHQPPFGFHHSPHRPPFDFHHSPHHPPFHFQHSPHHPPFDFHQSPHHPPFDFNHPFHPSPLGVHHDNDHHRRHHHRYHHPHHLPYHPFSYYGYPMYEDEQCNRKKGKKDC